MSDRQEPLKLQGGVAVITGAGSGIGRGLAHRLAREKMSLALADVDSAGLTETMEQLGGTSASLSCHLVDVADRGRMERFAAEVMERHGRVTLLMNIAGVANFLPILRSEPRAHIVNMSSIYGIIAPAGQTAYSASKFAVRGFTEALMHELDGSSVSISCVHPGGIRTPIAKRARVSGKSDPKAREVTLEMFDVLAQMPPEKAADRIVEGVLANEPRILVGGDAVQLDRMQRLMPIKYWDFLVRRSRKLMRVIGERRAKSTQA